jgi:thioredoxin 1
MSSALVNGAPALKPNARGSADAAGRPSTMSNAMAVTDADFDQMVEKADGLTVVDFWATWCGPCRMIAPILDQLAVEYAGQVKVTKLDVDANIKTATRFNVRSIPMLLFFKGGKVVDQIVGAVPRQTIEAKLKQHV